VAGSTGREVGYTSPYFQYDKSGGAKWTFARDYILMRVSALRGMEVVRALDKGGDGAENPCLAKAARHGAPLHRLCQERDGGTGLGHAPVY